MNPSEFKSAWEADGERLISYLPSMFAHFAIPPSASSFFCEAGLPSSAAPFLSFEAPSDGLLPTAAEAWRLPSKFDKYLVIGFNGSGDPIVLSHDGRVLYLAHDFGFSEHYINKDVQTLAKALLTHRSLIDKTLRIGGADAYLDGLVPSHLKESFVSFLNEIDPTSLLDGSMWADEISTWP